MSLPKPGNSVPLIRLLGVLSFLMIPCAGIHQLDGTPRIHGSWGRVIMLVMMAFPTALECAQRTIPAIGLDGKIRIRL